LVGGLAGCSARGGPSWIGVSFFGKQLVEDFPPRPGISTNQPTKLKSEREIVHQAVAQNGMALQYAAEELKSDREVVLQAVAQAGRALQYAAYELKGDREVVLEAVAQNGTALADAADALWRDQEIVLAALQSHPAGAMWILDEDWFFERVDEYGQWRAELAADRSFVEAALLAGEPDEAAALLEFGGFDAPTAVVLQLTFGLSGAKSCGVIAVQGTSALEVKQRALQKLGLAEEDVPSRDVAVVLEEAGCLTLRDESLVEAWPGVKAGGPINRATLVRVQKLARASEEDRGDPELVLPFLQVDGLNLQWADAALQDVEELVLAAVQQNPRAFQFASSRIKTRESFVTELLLADEESGKIIAMAVLHADPSALQWECLQRFQDSEQVVLAAVQRDFNAFEHASERLRDDEAAVLAAIQIDFRAFEFASARLRNELRFLERLREEVPAVTQRDEEDGYEFARHWMATEIDDLDLRQWWLGIVSLVNT